MSKAAGPGQSYPPLLQQVQDERIGLARREPARKSAHPELVEGGAETAGLARPLNPQEYQTTLCSC